MSYLTDLYFSGLNPANSLEVDITAYSDACQERDRLKRQLSIDLSAEQKLLLEEFHKKCCLTGHFERAAMFAYGFSNGIRLVYEALRETEL